MWWTATRSLPLSAELVGRAQRRGSGRGRRRRRLALARHRRERGAHTARGVAGVGARRTAVDREHFGAVVVDDHAAARLVVELGAQVAAKHRVANETHVVGAAVVLDATGLAL